MAKNTDIACIDNPVAIMANRMTIDQKELKDTLMKTAFSECKGDAEFISMMIIANTYNLNPLAREIFAYRDSKGNLCPIISTDGWNKIGIYNPRYVSHYYLECEKSMTMPNAKPCPEWMEIHIKLINGNEVIVREYLDEVFVNRNFKNPWQTHTKRMLRHKTKIQGYREAFGLSAYDEDEYYRVIEAQAELPQGKPIVEEPKAIVIEATVNVEKEEEKVISEMETEKPKEKSVKKVKPSLEQQAEAIQKKHDINNEDELPEIANRKVEIAKLLEDNKVSVDKCKEIIAKSFGAGAKINTLDEKSYNTLKEWIIIYGKHLREING